MFETQIGLILDLRSPKEIKYNNYKQRRTITTQSFDDNTKISDYSDNDEDNGK